MILFLGLALPRWHQPVTDDEIFEVRNAERLLAGEPIHLYVPPVYDLLLAAAIAAAGDGAAAMRFPGLACAALTLGLMLWLAAHLELTPAQRLWVVVLLATTPAFVQGALLIHIDNTLLVPATLAFLGCLLRWLRAAPSRTGRWALLTAACLSVALLVKFSTPLLAVAGAGIGLLVHQRQRLAGYAVLVAAGLLGFALLWWALAAWLALDPLEPFGFVVERVRRQQGSWAQWRRTWVRNGWTLAAWFGPWLLLGGGWALARIRRQTAAAAVLGGAFLGIVAYLPLTPINHGFPKYFLPALPLLVLVFIHQAGAPRRDRRAVLVVVVIATVWVLVEHEPVYFLRVEARQLLLDDQDPTGAVIRHLLMWTGPAIALVWWGRRWVGLAPGHWLVLLSLAGGLATSVQQSNAQYQTNYSYGERQTTAMETYLRQRLEPTDRVVATQDVLYRLGRHEQALGDSIWASPPALAARIATPATRFVVVSLAGQSLATMQALRAPPLQSVLVNFEARRIGTYTIFERTARDDPER